MILKMTTRNLNTKSLNWNISAKQIKTLNNENLTIDLSGNSLLYLDTSGTRKSVIGTNVDPSNSTYTQFCALTLGNYENSNNSGLNVYGSYFSNGVTALRIPADSSNNRPLTGKAGYIRYNTDNNYIEYFNSLNNTWSAISQPNPTYTSISPSYVPQDSSLNYTITGKFFNNYSSVRFKGNVDNIIYNGGTPTIFNSSTSLSIRNSLTMSAASSNTGFFILIENTDSGTNTISPNADLTFNTGPSWLSPAPNASVGTGIASMTYTYATSPFTDLSASDVNQPIKYYYSSGGSPVGAGSVTLDPSGRLIGTMPASASTYNFTAYAEDSFGSRGVTRTFAFTIVVPQITVNSVTYNISSPQSFTTQGYYTLSVNTNLTLKCQLWGAGGGGGRGNSGPTNGGAGGYVEGRVSFASGTTYVFLIGQGGAQTQYGPFGPSTTGTNAFPDGGASLNQESYGQACGGGSTRIGPNVANSPASYNSPSAVYYLIAGAGGGGGDYQLSPGGVGTAQGYGGYAVPNGTGTGGAAGGAYYPGGESLAACGGGGSQTAGGAAGSTPARLTYSVAGAKYSGGNGSGGGGGGGYYGGGGSRGYYAQAGGGSSYYNPSFVTNFGYLDTTAPSYSTSPNTGLASNRPGTAGNGGSGGASSPSPGAQGGTAGSAGAIVFTMV